MRAGKGTRRESGYGLVAVLLLLALVSIGLMHWSTAWTNDTQRDKEQQLIRIGAIYVQALERYRRASPGTDKRLPQELDELLLDQRFVGTVRHLRKLYTDPVRPGQPWGVIRSADGRIKGVYSLSDAQPITQSPVNIAGRPLPPASRYSDWQFLVDSDK